MKDDDIATTIHALRRLVVLFEELKDYGLQKTYTIVGSGITVIFDAKMLHGDSWEQLEHSELACEILSDSQYVILRKYQQEVLKEASSIAMKRLNELAASFSDDK